MLNLQTKRMDCIKSTILMPVLPQSETAFTKHATLNGCCLWESTSQIIFIRFTIVGYVYSDRHLCIPHATTCGTPCIKPISYQAYGSKKAPHKPDAASFIIRTAVLTEGFLPHAQRGLLTAYTPFLFSVKL